MDTVNDSDEDIRIVFQNPHDSYEMRPYFLVETINNEQTVGFIEEHNAFSSKFLKVIIPKSVNRKESYKYIPFNSITYLSPMSKEEAIGFLSSRAASQDFDQQANQDNQLPPFNFELDFELKKKWRSDKKIMVVKLGISLVSLVAMFVLMLKFPVLKEVTFGCIIISMVLLLSVIMDLIRSEVY